MSSPKSKIPPSILRLVQGSGGGGLLIAILYVFGFISPNAVPGAGDPIEIICSEYQVVYETSAGSQPVYRVVSDTIPLELLESDEFIDSLFLPTNFVFTKIIDIKCL